MPSKSNFVPRILALDSEFVILNIEKRKVEILNIFEELNWEIKKKTLMLDFNVKIFRVEN